MDSRLGNPPGVGGMMTGMMIPQHHPQQQQQQQGPHPGMSAGPQQHPQQGPPQHLHPHQQQQQGGGPHGHPIQQIHGGHGPPPHPAAPDQHHTHTTRMEAMNNISKAKALMPPIKDTLSSVLRTAASSIYANNMVDSGSKPVEFDVNKFDKNIEEFFTLCDQMEVQLRTSIECISLGMASGKNLSTPVTLLANPRTEGPGGGTLTYPQYINVVKGQVAFAKDVHSQLGEAAMRVAE